MSPTPPQRASVGSILFEVVIIAWCGYRLWQGDMSTTWKTIFVVVIGFSAFALLTKLTGGRPGAATPERSAAEGINELQKGMYSGAHEFRHVDDTALKGLDASFYGRATAALKGLGFRRMGQVVDVTAERVTPWARAVIRCFLDETNTVMAAIYDVEMRNGISGDFRTIDLETELSDGRFVATCNAPEAAKASDFPGIHRRFFSRDVPIADLVEHHRQFVRECQSARQGISAEPVVITSFEAYRASQDRMQILKSKHRNSAEYDPAEEIQRVMGHPLSPQERAVADHVRDIRESEGRGG